MRDCGQGTMKDMTSKEGSHVPLSQDSEPSSGVPCLQILRESQRAKGKRSSKIPFPEITELVGLELEDNSLITGNEI